jgi:nucleotidyltransferase/DNA polymerase involved in DNA repair
MLSHLRLRENQNLLRSVPHSRVVSATYEAKAFGVSRTLTSRVEEALAKCPELKVFRKQDASWGKQDSSKTRHATREILDCVKSFCSQYGDDIIIELASSDEIYLDISAEITRGMDQAEASSNESLEIPEKVVLERKTSSLQGPFKYVTPKRTVS